MPADQHGEATALVLVCTECGKESHEEARHWRALLGLEDDRETESVEVFCPECASSVAQKGRTDGLRANAGQVDLELVGAVLVRGPRDAPHAA